MHLEKSSGVFWRFPGGPGKSGNSGNSRGNPGDFREIRDFRGISGKFREIRGFRGSRGPPQNPGFWGIFRENPGFRGNPGKSGDFRALASRGARGDPWGGIPGGPESGVRSLQPLPGFWGFSGCRGPFNKCIFRSGFGVFFCAGWCGEFGGIRWCGGFRESGDSGDFREIWMSKLILIFLSCSIHKILNDITKSY